MSMSGSRVHIMKGQLIVQRSMTGSDGRFYDDVPLLCYQLRQNGRPLSSSYNYKGAGSVSGRIVVIGDPYNSTQLLEVEVDEDPTQESQDQWDGFGKAIDEKRAPKDPYAKYSSKSADWWQGYREGQAKKKLTKAPGVFSMGRQVK